MIELIHPDGVVKIRSLSDGRNEITVRMGNPSAFCPTNTCETSYSCNLIEATLKAKGAAYLCDEILRDESPGYVEKDLRNDILGYARQEEFAGKRIMDFGCGCGASTVILARMFPGARIIGVELLPAFAEVGRQRAAHYHLQNVEIVVSPSGQQLPQGIGPVDFIILSAVYEHLLPAERDTLLPALWSVLRAGGILFLNQTPYRWTPVEAHTTGLPFINYLPARLAHFAATRLSRRVPRLDSWETLLRKGIRGGSERQIVAQIRASGENAVLLGPTAPHVSDRIDLWYAVSPPGRLPTIKKGVWYILKGVKALTGWVIVPYLSLAIQKPTEIAPSGGP